MLDLYTVFCQQANGRGTIHINTLEADSLLQAVELGILECASAWHTTEVRCLGVAEGDIKILHWSDLDE